MKIKTDSIVTFDMQLKDEKGTLLVNLPVTFQLTNKNILIMLLGNDKSLALADSRRSVWLFESTQKVKKLLNLNKNVKVTKDFKKSTELNPFFKTPDGIRQIALYKKTGTVFDNGYEIIQGKIKPIIFEIFNNPEEVKFYLNFYIAEIDTKNPYLQTLTAKAKAVTIKLKINK
ncbi:MAG: hypothetical protein LBS28_01165 [Streptococcaceae bacterium]|nr:hypothetical protein [Streptococcaceae bacterium]